MDTSLVRSGAAIAFGSAFYYLAAFIVLPWAGVLAPPIGSHMGLQVAHTFLMLVLSLPFALALASSRLAIPRPVLVALAVSFFALVLPALPNIGLTARPGWSGVSAVLDYLKFLGTLPLLTWLACRWRPSSARTV